MIWEILSGRPEIRKFSKFSITKALSEQWSITKPIRDSSRVLLRPLPRAKLDLEQKVHGAGIIIESRMAVILDLQSISNGASMIRCPQKGRIAVQE
jgi:hypothetical protein